MITKDDVLKVANMSRFNLKEDKVEEYREQLGKILGIIDLLNEVNVEGIKPLYSPLEKSNYFRSDNVEESYLKDKIVESSKICQDGRIIVPQVVG